jgi:thiamine-monophosphate kinase
MHPLTGDHAQSIGAWGELRLLAAIRHWLGDCAPPNPVGMGDDCAVLDRPAGNLLTVDSVIFGRHFDADVPPAAVGAKLMHRNLSDIAAMGGEPRFALLAGALPAATAHAWVAAMVQGLAAAARQHGVLIVGGDLAQSATDLVLTLTLTGHAARPLLRSGGQPGDHIVVTGQLGGSRAGRHYAFEPRLAEGRALAADPRITVAMDVTDGLATDLPKLLPAGCGAELDLAAVPLADAAVALAAGTGKPAWWHALCDGEDYELLFLVPAAVSITGWLAAWNADPRHAAATCIGRVVAGGRGLVDSRDGLPLRGVGGYEHFS